MPEANPSSEPLDSEDRPDDLVCVGSYQDSWHAQEHALVILAMGEPCWIDAATQGGYTLHVEPSAEQAVHAELDAYEEESTQQIDSSHHDTSPFTHSPGWEAYLLWLGLLVSIHLLQADHPELTDRGASSSIGLIKDHEWWRPFTALFLHADASHLLGNLLSGLFFATLVSRSIGQLRGWLYILGCGTIGNIATSLTAWPEPYRAIGASTATFAALGILSGLGFSWMLRHRHQLPWLRMSAPVIAGIVVLGMTGSGLPGGNTDVLGHIYGFSAGAIIGLLQGMLGDTLRHTSSS